MDIIPPALIETGENDAAPEEKTPLQMANEAHQKATVLWVKDQLSEHGRHCPALKNIRSLRAYLLIGIGFVLSASMWGTVTIQASLRADRLELKDEFREILRTELAKVAMNDDALPSPMASPSVPPSSPALVSQPKPRKLASRASASPPTAGARWLNPLNYVQASQ